MKHWIVYKGTNGITIYEQVDYVPNGSRILAEEIDGMNQPQAIKTLETMYDKVATVRGSRKLFCTKGKTEMTDNGDFVEVINCPRCGVMMEPRGDAEWECTHPFCESNDLNPAAEYSSLMDDLKRANTRANRTMLVLRGLMKCIKHEQISGSAAFNDLVANANVLLMEA